MKHRPTSFFTHSLALALALVVPAFAAAQTGADESPWQHYAGDAGASRYAPLDQITAENVATQLLGAETSAGLETGYLEQAIGGTLFVEELQDLCPDAQRLLFGVLDQGEFSRVGRAVRTPVNIRVMTSVRPETLADPASFGIRPDLISMLSRLRLRVPPLRDYAEDIPELLRYFVDRLVDYNGLPFRRFGVAAQNRLRNYPWPGNIRELESLVQKLLIAEY